MATAQQATPKALPRRWPQAGLAAWIAGIVMLALLPLAAFSAWVLWHQLGEQQAQSGLAMRQRAQVAAMAVSHELASLYTPLALLAEQEQRDPADAAVLRQQAGRLLQGDGRFVAVALADAGGEQPLQAAVPEGAPLPPVFVLQFQRPQGEGDPRGLSPVHTGARAGAAFALAPPLPPPAGRERWLRAVVRAEAVGARLNEQPWPPGWAALLVDQAQAVVAHSGRGPAGAGPLPVAGAPAAGPEFEAPGSDGRPWRVATAAVPGTPWQVWVAQPLTALEAQARAPLLSIVAAGLLCAAVALAAGLGLARLLSRQLRAVVEARRQAGGARPQALIAEVDALAEALDRAEADAAQASGALSEAREDALQRLRERSEMLDVLAHEVRQPLNNAGSALQAAAAVLPRAPAGDGGAAAAPLQRAAAVLGEVQASIDNTLAAAALLVGSTVAREDGDIDALLAVALADLPPADAARVRVQRDTATRTAAMDAGLMRLALRNLVSNALKFSPPGSAVTVRLADSDEPLALLIDVIDTGPGIAEDRLPHLFQRSGQRPLGASGRRQGLGLYIVRRVMEVQGGGVELLRNGPGGVTMRLVVNQGGDED